MSTPITEPPGVPDMCLISRFCKLCFIWLGQIKKIILWFLLIIRVSRSGTIINIFDINLFFPQGHYVFYHFKTYFSQSAKITFIPQQWEGWSGNQDKQHSTSLDIYWILESIWYIWLLLPSILYSSNTISHFITCYFFMSKLFVCSYIECWRQSSSKHSFDLMIT